MPLSERSGPTAQASVQEQERETSKPEIEERSSNIGLLESKASGTPV